MRIVVLGFAPVKTRFVNKRKIDQMLFAKIWQHGSKVTLDLQTISHRFNGFFILILFLFFVRCERLNKERFNSKLFSQQHKKSSLNGNFSKKDSIKWITMVLYRGVRISKGDLLTKKYFFDLKFSEKL
jgi:hypothetical protein